MESASDFDAFSLDISDQPESIPMASERSREIPAAPQSDVPDWLTEPDSDFFALGAESPGEEQPSSEVQPSEQLSLDSQDWFAELEAGGDTGVGSMADFGLPAASEDALRAEALGDEGDWLAEPEAIDDDAGLMAALGQMGDESLALDAEFTLDDAGSMAQGSDEFSLFDEESEALAADLPDWIRAARPDAEAVEAVDELFEADEVSPALFESALKENTPVVEDWMPQDASEKFEFGEPVSGAALDWLQPQAAEDDWLGTFARPTSEEAELNGFCAGRVAACCN